MAYIDWWNRTGPITLGERFGLNEISIARNTLSPTKSHTAGLSESFPGTFTSYNDAVSEGFQGTREEWLQQQSIPITERPLTGAAGGRVGFKDGTTMEEIMKATEKKYKDFVKAFKKKNKRNPSMTEIKAQIKGGGDWATIRKYLVEGEDFLTQSETMKMLQPAKVLIEDMPKGMNAWLEKEKIEVEWRSVDNQERAKLKKRFDNRNNPHFKALEQKKIFQDHIDGLIKKGETSAWEKSIMDLVKESKAKIEKGTAQEVLLDKKFAVKGSRAEKLFPKLEARAIELFNEGLSAPEVTTTLEDEGIIKVRKSWDKSKGAFTRDIRIFNSFYKDLLKEGKIKTIAETIAGKQIPNAERTRIDKAILDYMKKNPDIDSSNQIAKAVSLEVNRDINQGWVKSAIIRSGQDPDKFFQTSSKKIFPDVKVLDKLIKNNQKLLDSDISFKDKSRILIQRYAEATGKPLKIATDEFVTRLRKLGNLYSEQPQRFEKALYNTIKAPANYVGSSFHENFVALADASGRLSVVDKAKLLKLPQNEIKLLSELSTAASKLGGFSMAGDHTDGSALMKNFDNYRKEFTRIEWVRDSLNRFKQIYDNKILALYRAAKRGQTTVLIDGEQVPIKDRIEFWQTEFKNKTGYRLGDFKIDAKGTPYIEPTALRIPDIKNPINTVLKQTLQGLATYKVPETARHSAQKPIEVTNAFDKAMMRVRNAGERIEAFKKWKGKSELLNSRYIKALGAVPRLKGFVKLLTAGTMTSAALITLATAGTTLEKGITTEEMKKRKEEIEPGDKTQEASVGASLGEYLLGGAGIGVGTAISNYPKQAWELAKKAVTKPLALSALPTWKVAGSIKETFKAAAEKRFPNYKLTDPNTWMHAAFWDWGVKTFGLDKTATAFGESLKGLSKMDKARAFRNWVGRGLLSPKAVKFVSSKVAWPLTGIMSVHDAYKDYQERKEFLTPERIAEAQEEEFDKEEPMFAMGGIASLIK